MSAWLQECPECMYVAKDISHATEAESNVVRELGYIEAGLVPDLPALAGRFLRRAYIEEATGASRAAAQCLLCAAWVLDDLEMDARLLRLRAASLLSSLSDLDSTTLVQRIDLLRRGHAFAEAIAAADALLLAKLDQVEKSIVLFERFAAYKKRDTAFTVSQALSAAPRRGGLKGTVRFLKPKGGEDC